MFCFGASAYYILGSRRLTNLMGGWEDGWEGEGRERGTIKSHWFFKA